MNLGWAQEVADAATSCKDVAIEVGEGRRQFSTKTRSKWGVASDTPQNVKTLVQWLGHLIHGTEDIYLKQVDTKRIRGEKFFPPGEIQVYPMADGDEVYFEEESGEYFRFSLGKEPVMLELRAQNLNKDDIYLGALSIEPVESDADPRMSQRATMSAVMNNCDGGSIYHIRYSIVWENWAKPATTQAQTGIV